MRLCLLLLLLLIACPFSGAEAKERLVIGIPCLNAENCRLEEAEDILSEAYSRVGAEVKFKHLPMKRDLIEASEMTIDGSAFRSKIGLEAYPELIPVETPLAKITYVAFMAHPEPPVKSWDDLRHLRVGIMRGDMIGTVSSGNAGIAVHPVTSLSSGFKMLEVGRLDAFIYEKTVGTLQAQALKLNVHPSEPLYSGYTYHALNRKHAALVPKLGQALREMLEDGTTARLIGKFKDMLPSEYIK